MLLNLHMLNKKYSLDIKKLAHIGAHKGQEVDEYLKIFPTVEICLFEPQVELFTQLEDKYDKLDNFALYNFALGSSTNISSMYRADNEGQSSSFYKPKEHLIEHPEIKFTENSEVFEIKALDELGIMNIDFLNIDTQGYELEVLKGSKDALGRDVKYIMLEINKKELYDSCPLVKDIDDYLDQYNFTRVATQYWNDTYSWGDAFYIKKDLISFKQNISATVKNQLLDITYIYRTRTLVRKVLKKLRRFFN
jgi:FkbM family methyltransferase